MAVATLEVFAKRGRHGWYKPVAVIMKDNGGDLIMPQSGRMTPRQAFEYYASALVSADTKSRLNPGVPLCPNTIAA